MTMSNRIAVMNAGRMEQVGEPQAVYELPSTRFVAGFLGASNLLPGEVDGAGGGDVKVRLESGAMVTLPAERLPVRSGPVEVGVRPEKILISPTEASGSESTRDNVVEAQVVMSTYTGVSTSYECRTPQGSMIVVYVQNLGDAARPIGAGEKVRLSWHPDHTFAVAPGPAVQDEEEGEGR